MSQHFGKRLCKVPFSYLQTGMKVISFEFGAGSIILLEERKDDWYDNRITIQWDEVSHSSCMYHGFFSFVALAHDEFKVNRMPSSEDSSSVSHTYGSFKTCYYVFNKRYPTEQEVFDAGVRAGRDIQWLEKHSVMGHLHPEGLTPAQKVVALAGNVRLALLALKRIAEGHAEPAKYAELTIKHLDTPSSKYMISNELSVKDIQEILDAIVARNVKGEFPIDVPIYLGVSLTELEEYTHEVLKRYKV